MQEDLTELGNAKLVCAVSEKNYKWLREAKNWMTWEGDKWKLDDNGKTYRLYELILDYFKKKITEANVELIELNKNPDVRVEGSEIYREAERITNLITSIQKWYMSSQRSATINGSLSLAKSPEDMTVSMSNIDKHPKYFGVKNGVIDISTGELLSEDKARDLYIMQIAGINYDKSAKYEEWENIITKLMLGDGEMAVFLQTLLGSALIGANSKYFTFFYGSGSNGKTTILEIVDRIMGDYAVTGDADLFTKNTKKNKEYYFAMYHGKRLIVFNETDKEMVNLSEDLIKQTTDSGQVTGRHPGGQPFDYVPQFTPIFSVNHLPNVSNDSAVWRRTIIVPFDYVVPDAEKEDDYVGRMVNEQGSGILNWLLVGAREYLKNGIELPEKLKLFTSELKAETDVLATFLGEYVGDSKPDNKILASNLRNEYVQWLSENGYKRAPTIRNYCTDLRAGGIEVKKATGNKTYVFGLDEYGNGVTQKKIDKATDDGITDLTKLLKVY